MQTHPALNNLRQPDSRNPLRILVSACLLGTECGFDGTANGKYPSVLKLREFNTAKLLSFCPEDFSFGTPRELCDIHGGNGFDVLEGKAKVITEKGEDWTDGMVAAAQKMLALAKRENVELAVLMDISAACGSTVIYNGSRLASQPVYQTGAGVCAALLIKNGFPVISQRDYASLERLYALLDKGYIPDSNAIDHHQSDWYTKYFNEKK